MAGDVSIEPADEAGRLALSAFMPEAADPRVELLVARRTGAFAGAAAIQWETRRDPPGFGLQVRVAPEHRRSGVGRALVAAAKARCRGEAAGLWAAQSARLDSPAADFLRACGFREAERHHHFRLALADFQAHVGPAVRRARRRGGGALRIVSVAEAPLAEVAWLVGAEIAAAPMGLQRLLEQAAPTDRLSQVALADGRVAGALLIVAHGAVAHLDVWVVAPDFRGGAASLALFETAIGAGLAAGIAELTFDCADEARDTVRLARRAGAIDTPGAAFYAAI